MLFSCTGFYSCGAHSDDGGFYNRFDDRCHAFNTIITNSSKSSKIEESNIEGMIGLEMMRHDLEQMGFGLPWGFEGSSDVR